MLANAAMHTLALDARGQSIVALLDRVTVLCITTCDALRLALLLPLADPAQRMTGLHRSSTAGSMQTADRWSLCAATARVNHSALLLDGFGLVLLCFLM